MPNDLLSEIKVVRVANAAGAATTAVTSATVDMTGWDSVVFVAELGDVTATCVVGLKAQLGDESDGSDAADYGTALGGTAGATDYDNHNVVLEVNKPVASASRYARCVLSRGTANAVVNGIQAILCKRREASVAIDASTALQGKA